MNLNPDFVFCAEARTVPVIIQEKNQKKRSKGNAFNKETRIIILLSSATSAFSKVV